MCCTNNQIVDFYLSSEGSFVGEIISPAEPFLFKKTLLLPDYQTSDCNIILGKSTTLSLNTCDVTRQRCSTGS